MLARRSQTCSRSKAAKKDKSTKVPACAFCAFFAANVIFFRALPPIPNTQAEVSLFPQSLVSSNVI
jgi:hypothetical protein